MDAQRASHLRGPIAAAVIHHQVLDHIRAGDLARQGPHRFRQGFPLIVAGDLNDDLDRLLVHGEHYNIGENRDAFRDDRDIAVFLKTHWKYMSIGEKIEACWLDDKNQASPAWKEHRDINMVMLATSLAPDGFLTLFRTP